MGTRTKGLKLILDEKVRFVEKAPPNVPQNRPIESLWCILAHKVYEGEWQASTQQELIGRIQSQLKKIDSKSHGQCEDKFACHSGQWSASHI